MPVVISGRRRTGCAPPSRPLMADPQAGLRPVALRIHELSLELVDPCAGHAARHAFRPRAGDALPRRLAVPVQRHGRHLAPARRSPPPAAGRPIRSAKISTDGARRARRLARDIPDGPGDPGLVPERVNHWRVQQRRWSTGFVQVANKLLRPVWTSNWSLGRKGLGELPDPDFRAFYPSAGPSRRPRSPPASCCAAATSQSTCHSSTMIATLIAVLAIGLTLLALRDPQARPAVALFRDDRARAAASSLCQPVEHAFDHPHHVRPYRELQADAETLSILSVDEESNGLEA